MSSIERTVAVVVGVDDVVAEPRAHGEEEPGLARSYELLDHVVERSVGQPVAVGREEQLVVADVHRDREEPIADRRLDPGVEEGDRPVVHVAAEQLDVSLPVREHEVVRERLVVVEEVLLDSLAAVAEAEDELRVPPRRVPLHDVPEDRAARRS